MGTLSLRNRIKLNALVMQYSEVSDPTFTISVFRRAYERTGSAEIALEEVRQSGHLLWQQHMAVAE